MCRGLNAIHPCPDAAGDRQVLLVTLVGYIADRSQKCRKGIGRSCHVSKKKANEDSHLFRVTVT